MNSRDESSPMSPTKHFVAIFGPTAPISQSDIMRSDDFREDGDLCEEEDEEGEGDASWHNNPVGSSLGLLAAIKEEDSGDERSPKRSERVYPVDNSLVEKLSYGYFDYPLTKKTAPIEKPIQENINSPKVVTDLDTDHFGRPRTAERPKTPSPEKREQRKHEPFVRSSSPACIDCIVGGKDHHHGRAPVQSPPPSRTSFSKAPSSSSLKRASSESISSEFTPAKESRPSNVTGATVGVPNQSTISNDLNPVGFTAPQRPLNEVPTPTLRRTGNLPVRELTPSREQDTLSNPIDASTAPVLRRVPTLHRELTPPREQASLNLSIPTPPKEPVSNPYYERTPTKQINPTTPARQRVPAIPPTPPSTPARRKSLPHDFSRSYLNLPTPVEEEPSTTPTQSTEETKVDHGHSHQHGEDGYKCPFVTRARSFRDMRQTKSYSYNPGTPESVRSLSHSYSAPNIHDHRRSSSLPSNTDPSRLSMSYGSYSRPTTPELSRLSQSYSYSRPSSSDGPRRPGSSDGFRRPGSSDGFRRPGSSDGLRRPGSSDGSRLAYPYSRPTTPDVIFSGTGTKAPFVERSESLSRSSSPPPPPPPTVASSVGTSPASSLLLSPLAPAINFKKDTAQRTMSRSISESDLYTMDRFFGSLQRRLALEREREGEISEPESPLEELAPEPTIEAAVPEVPKIEITEPKAAEPKTIEVAPQNFITEFVIPRITKYYLQGPTFWNIIISFWIFFFVLGSLITVSTGFVYFFGDGTASSGLKGALFGEGKPLEDLSPLIAILLYSGLFAWVTVYSRRTISPEAEEVKKRGLLAEIIGPQQAAWAKRRFSPRRMKMVLLLCLITAGMRGLYLGGQIVGPPLVAGVNKGVATGVDYWNTIRAPTTEVSAETEVKTEVSDPWEDMDFMYIQSTGGKTEEKYVSSMEGSQGTYYPGVEDQGYFGDEDELGWGAVMRLGLALVAGPAGVMAWRRRRSL